jgi:hypothetical protein
MPVRSSTVLTIRKVVRRRSPSGYSDLEIFFRTFFLACSVNPGKNVCGFGVINAHSSFDPRSLRDGQRKAVLKNNSPIV